MSSIRASNIIFRPIPHVVYSATLLSREEFENRITVRLLFYEPWQKDNLPWVLFSAFTVTQEKDYGIMWLNSKNKTTCKPENRHQKDTRLRENPNLTLLNLKNKKQSEATNKQIQVDITYIIALWLRISCRTRSELERWTWPGKKYTTLASRKTMFQPGENTREKLLR